MDLTQILEITLLFYCYIKTKWYQRPELQCGSIVNLKSFILISNKDLFKFEDKYLIIKLKLFMHGMTIYHSGIKPIRMSALNMDQCFKLRMRFTKLKFWFKRSDLFCTYLKLILSRYSMWAPLSLRTMLDPSNKVIPTGNDHQRDIKEESNQSVDMNKT